MLCAQHHSLRTNSGGRLQSAIDQPQNCNNRRYDEYDYNGSFEHGSALQTTAQSPRSKSGSLVCSRGLMGQVSGPEQNPIVTELADPSQHLFPATSKTASGSSLLNTSSS